MNESKKLSLAARYRPQTFADVAGQDMVKAVLSRACAEDRPACAYLFSGTRGVGKTTIARIFAKALNCAHAPAAEPCNACPQCQKIMQGNHVDVIEIDGASNNKVEDVRSLRETVGYAPMEGRYKVFIIDEAHMLSTSAFNALLKTLEEPPPRVIFIMATTEAHKFPVTIISRCQHFTFRHLNEDELVAHLKAVLTKEGITFEDEAVSLLAKRAQGSVRDSMSLLDQTLALGNDTLTVAVTRDVLGLAGQEFFEQLFAAMCAADCAQVVTLTQNILRRGIDIGFFIRELAGYFRSLFLLAQGGAAIKPVLKLPPGEERLIDSLANKLSLAHLHAAWQLVLDSQRSVVQSTEPASSLELLLLHLALLPKLLPLDNVCKEPVKRAAPESENVPPQNQAASARPPVQGSPKSEPVKAEAPKLSPKPSEAKATPFAQKEIPPSELKTEPPKPKEAPAATKIVQSEPAKPAVSVADDRAWDDSDEDDDYAPGSEEVLRDIVLDWSDFVTYYCEQVQPNVNVSFAERDLRSLAVQTFGRHVQIEPEQQFQYDRLMQISTYLEQALKAYLRTDLLMLDICKPEQRQSSAELTAALQAREELQPCFSLFSVDVEHCRKR